MVSLQSISLEWLSSRHVAANCVGPRNDFERRTRVDKFEA
jgi:hypothetical protein